MKPRPLDDELDALDELPLLDQPASENDDLSGALDDDAEEDLVVDPAIPHGENGADEAGDAIAVPLDVLFGTLHEEASALGDGEDGPSVVDDDDLEEDDAQSFLGSEEHPNDDDHDDLYPDVAAGADDGGVEGPEGDEQALDDLPPLDGEDDDESPSTDEHEELG